MQLKIYTDGACSGNPGPGGFAYVLVVPTNMGSESLYRENGGFRLTTNNRMEILAAAEGIEAVYMMMHNDAAFSGLESVAVVSDSALVVETMNQGWKRKSNNDLWRRLDDAITRLRNNGVPVTFEKVEGHAGDTWNNVADELAVQASHKQPDSLDADKAYEASLAQKNQPAVTPDQVRDYLATAAADATGSAYHLLASMFATRELSLEKLAAELTRHLS